MLPSLAQLPVGTFIAPGLRDGTLASLEAVGRLECSICYQPLGDAEGWVVPCVNHHAFHRACLGAWVRQAAPRVGADRVPCPDCQKVMTYPNGDGATYRQIAGPEGGEAGEAGVPRREEEPLDWLEEALDRQDAALAPDEDALWELVHQMWDEFPPDELEKAYDQQRTENSLNEHRLWLAVRTQATKAQLDLDASERYRKRLDELDLLDWWSAMGDESGGGLSIPDPDPVPRREIMLYPTVLTQTFELAAFGPAGKQRRDALAALALAKYGAAWDLVEASVRIHDGSFRLLVAHQGSVRDGKLHPPPSELKQWVDEYRVRERAIAEARAAARVTEAAHRAQTLLRLEATVEAGRAALRPLEEAFRARQQAERELREAYVREVEAVNRYSDARRERMRLEGERDVFAAFGDE